MDWQALLLSAELATATLCVLLPVALWMARWLAHARFTGKALVLALVVLPLVLVVLRRLAFRRLAELVF